jgi:NAD(P)-dependent dehydrogenase (short-subunit alcohol dehydrogenase family)
VFDKVISVNARGSLLVIKHVTPGMIARGVGGRS